MNIFTKKESKQRIARLGEIIREQFSAINRQLAFI